MARDRLAEGRPVPAILAGKAAEGRRFFSGIRFVHRIRHRVCYAGRKGRDRYGSCKIPGKGGGEALPPGEAHRRRGRRPGGDRGTAAGAAGAHPAASGRLLRRRAGGDRLSFAGHGRLGEGQPGKACDGRFEPPGGAGPQLQGADRGGAGPRLPVADRPGAAGAGEDRDLQPEPVRRCAGGAAAGHLENLPAAGAGAGGRGEGLLPKTVPADPGL